MKLIPLSQGKFAQVDDEDYDHLMQWKWSAIKSRNRFYAKRKLSVNESDKESNILLHRQIMNITDPKILIDHIDRDGLNCQKANMRMATVKQNCTNKDYAIICASKYLGVTAQRDKNGLFKKWRAQIKVSSKRIHLGLFTNEELAAIAYDSAAKIHHGEFANLNFK